MTQLGFDWDRAERDRWIDEADLMPESMQARGSTVKRHWMVNMLRTLNGFVSKQSPECWASQKLLAIKMGLRSQSDPEESERGIKTVQRTLDALSDLSLIIVHRRVPKGGMKPVNHYRLVWSELMLLSSKRRALLFPNSQSKEPDEQQDFFDDQQDFSNDQQDFFCDQQDLKSSNLLTSSKSIKSPPLKSPQIAGPQIAGSRSSVVQVEEEVGDASSFDRLVDDYERVPVYGAAELLGRAVHRVGAEYLERLLKHYRDHPGAWGPGALRNRVNHSRPGMEISAGWPSPAKAQPVPEPKSSERRGDAWSAAKLAQSISRTNTFRRLRDELGRAPTESELDQALGLSSEI
jgi:hypothetical protein